MTAANFFTRNNKRIDFRWSVSDQHHSFELVIVGQAQIQEQFKSEARDFESFYNQVLKE